jgi:hypothetical protein
MDEYQEVAVEDPIVQDDAVEEVSQESSADRNWKQARAVMADQKRELEELKAMMSQMTQTKQAPEEEAEEEDDFDDADEDDYVTVANARKIAQKAKLTAEKHAYKAAEKVLKQHMHNQNISTSQDRARAKYDDYDDIIQNYTIPLIKNDPALAHKINTSKDPALAAYRAGKISDEYLESSAPKMSAKAEKVVRNSQQPASSHAGQGLKAQVAALSENMTQDQVWALAQQYASGG